VGCVLTEARHNSSTNATLTDDERTFPFDHALYVDATHEVVVLNGTSTLLHAPFPDH
jgi:hypothetical protein